MVDKDPVEFCYEFTFEDGARVELVPRLDPITLALLNGATIEPPSWTTLGSVNCECCRLEGSRDATCPLAANIAELIDRFSSRLSYEKVGVRVTTAERTYMADTTVQQALSSLTGIYMVTSGCPTMDRLRPMVRFHLPLASLQETTYRAISMYLLGQYLRLQHGEEPDWSLAGLEEVYKEIHVVNMSIVRCIRAAAEHDGNANALVRLDLFAGGVSFSIHDALKDLDYLFAGTYFDFPANQ